MHSQVGHSVEQQAQMCRPQSDVAHAWKMNSRDRLDVYLCCHFPEVRQSNRGFVKPVRWHTLPRHGFCSLTLSQATGDPRRHCRLCCVRTKQQTEGRVKKEKSYFWCCVNQHTIENEGVYVSTDPRLGHCSVLHLKCALKCIKLCL